MWLLALLSVSSTLLAGPQGYYRWKDDKGQFQATQQPPSDRPSEFVRTSTGTSSQMAPGESADSAGTPPKATNQAAGSATKKPAGMQAIPDKDPEKCKQAQDTQAVLNSHARIREKDEKGEYRYLAPEEINEQKKLATESVDVYCDPAPAQ
ncbi:MAG TPA: hypothetical protein VLC91_10030 [Spongiibacteraceae bacterium]|nr:hypothetical protein [Spongiibacteraceae bacterium]